MGICTERLTGRCNNIPVYTMSEFRKDVDLKVAGVIADDAKDGWHRKLMLQPLLPECHGPKHKIRGKARWNVQPVRVGPSKVRLQL